MPLKRLLLLLVVGCSLRAACAQQDSLRVVFYNVENLFDCRHDSLKNDQEYLPDALRRWTPSRYHHKLNQLTKVLAAAGGRHLPHLIGLCEVENEHCLHDLTRRTALRQAGYRYLITQSPDPRGIDVALLYQPGHFLPLSHRSIRLNPAKVGHRGTRDILHVSGRIRTGDTLDVFVVHTPSRAGGSRTHAYRLYANQVLRSAADSLFRVRTHPYICLMGDFNDTPQSPSLTQGLQARSPRTPIQPHQLYNLVYHHHQGSYRYRGHWELLDQCIVSGTLLQPHSPLRTSEHSAHLLRLPFLLQEDERYGGHHPFRTYHGMKYQGGFSDHLPLLYTLYLHP